MLGGTQRDHGTVVLSYDNNSVCIPETGTGSMGPSVQRPEAYREAYRRLPAVVAVSIAARLR